MLAPGNRVGEPVFPGTGQLRSGAHYNYTNLGHRFVAAVEPSFLSAAEMVDQRKAVFGLIKHKDVIIFIAGFGAIVWAASHYNWWFNPPHRRPNPFADLSVRKLELPLEVIIADAARGLVIAVQRFDLPEHFSRMLFEAVASQVFSEFDSMRHLELAAEALPSGTDRMSLMKRAVCACSFGMTLPVCEEP
ncbi:MAG: hypothetical protein EHM37_06475 [Deltaproteobacteria bacterium]|nr:MAG: hypothetical protein EHM37_06475 [Deltaproteobacteria bacterium]